MGALISAGAAAADLCHTPLPGTRSLTLRANVTGYQFAGNRVVVEWSRSARCGGTTFWEPSQPRTTAPASCQRAAAPQGVHAATKLTASDATHAVRVIPAPIGADKADRLVVFDRATNRRIASWPLFERPARVALYGGIAILSGRTRHELYAMRVSDGRMAQIGIARGGDAPVIGRVGVVYQDDLDLAKHRTAPAERTLKLLPLQTVRRELARPFSTVHMYMSYSRAPAGHGAVRASTARNRLSTSRPPHRGALPPHPHRGDPITAMSMDGTRVALAVHDPTGRCDYVLFWNITWHYVTRLTRASGPQCLPVHDPGGITNVAISGSRAVWTTKYGARTRVLAASITDCQEWVVARPRTGVEDVTALAGDTGILAYALAPEQRFAASTISRVGVVPASWGGVAVERFQSQVEALSAYNKRIATLGSNGMVAITALSVGVDRIASIPTRGKLTGEIQVGQARAIALREHVLAALSGRSTLDLYSLPSGRLLHTWPAPASATSVDVQYGIALITAGNDVYAVNTASGKTARIFHAPAKVAAQIEAPGAAIEFNNAGHGHIAFLPMSRIEASIR
jgi:DNA-binding beta-propeller fold protein YncE